MNKPLDSIEEVGLKVNEQMKKPYKVWWTGTQGHAEWLEAHSTTLRDHSELVKCSKSLSEIPDNLRPVFALEQPDLVISDADGQPLLSIELTEQQEFGTNAQQRMARFWSALASKIPSAYLLPIESYQFERASASEIRILEESDPLRRQLLLLIATLPGLRSREVDKAGIKSAPQLLEAIREGRISLPNGKLTALQAFVAKYIDQDGEVEHIKSVEPDEVLHTVGDQVYKAYIRTPKVTSSMVLEWMHKASGVVPTFPFKIQSDYRLLFQTNGLPHTIVDLDNPHLSYRNLPPAPGRSPVVNRLTGKDEFRLFFEFVDGVLGKETSHDFGREMFVKEGEYYEPTIKDSWRQSGASAKDVVESRNGDFACSSNVVSNILRRIGYSPSESTMRHIEKYHGYHVYKISCGVKRGLADPYTGALAVRDVLFCRDSNDLKDLARFKRSTGLIFFVEMTGLAAADHSFLYPGLHREHQRLVGRPTNDPQAQLIELCESARIEQITKDLRAHLLFSDYIIVRRIKNGSDSIEFLSGVPSLLVNGLISEDCQLIRSLAV